LPLTGRPSMDSISRHEQLLRVFHLIDMLFSARQPLSVAELKRELQDRRVIDEMSDKNIRRDIEFLEKFGYSIARSKKRSPRGGSCLAFAISIGPGKAELRPPVIGVVELLSLAVARDFLAPLAGTFYWRGIGQLITRLETVATPQLLDYVNEHKEGLVVHPRPATGKYGSRMLAGINRAIRQRVELEIRYTSLTAAKPKKSIIQPEALVVYEGSIYVAAYRSAAEPAAEQIRFYKLDRISDARPSSRSFERRPQPVEELLADSMTMFRAAEPPRRYRLRIAAERARWAVEKPFHPGQIVRPQADGSLLLEIPRAWDDEMLPQLLALGEHVEVLEPEEARDRLLETARAIIGKYACRHIQEFDAIYAKRATADLS
jgi:predicted DNA-binding transcriptional regulator YafY